ncbi:GCN5-like N-acetyltransferase [Halobiforma nitratireducens JCM 10879]|uniref:GCN5-like N-acetyltransferase n=1 Tax=Halobiforma nitratireducens JCM 10879 TaxID=1227454 RepID=M0M2D6_9EURY|nr:GCN5-like N-acetyltransferase [Halobiforma nitratireducens JCM 10879]
MTLEYEVLGWPPDGPKLRLDHERFSYAGKFVMTNTGKAVARDGDEAVDAEVVETRTGSDRDWLELDDVVAAIAFNEDRTDAATLWLRYVTVARDRRGEGIGPQLCSLVRDRALERGYDRLRIAVNNPFAYEALYRAGFGYTGETTGIAELVLEYPRPTDERGSDTETNGAVERYQNGLAEFRDRDLSVEEEAFLESRAGNEPPSCAMSMDSDGKRDRDGDRDEDGDGDRDEDGNRNGSPDRPRST